MSTYKILLTLVLTMIITTSANASTICDQEFFKIFQDKELESYDEKIAYWISMKKNCSGNGLYELRLAQLYFDVGDFQKSREVLHNGLKLQSNYEKELIFNLGHTEAALGNFELGKNYALKLTKDYSDWAGGYSLLGDITTWLNQPSQAIDAFEKSNELDEKALTYSMLALNYHYLEMHEKSILAMQNSLKLDLSQIGHQAAIPATAYSLIALGYYDEAEELLIEHQKVRPESKDDPEFVKVAVYLHNKIKELGE